MIRNLIVLIALVLITFSFSGCGQTKLEDELLDGIGLCFEFDLKCGEEHDDRFDSIQQRLNQLEALAFLNRELINVNETSIQSGNASLNNIVMDLQTQINSLTSQQSINNDDIILLQNAISDLEDATAQGIVEVIDPCGDNPNQFDEVIIKLADGSHIAYFESGGKRFLTTLGEGSFRTTDKQKCNFSIVNGELID
jgi:hypothetical protein